MCTIITKSLRTFIGQTSVEYYKLTINNGSVIEEELDPTEARTLIKDMPLIHKLDNNNMIWGDNRFKDLCPKSFIS